MSTGERGTAAGEPVELREHERDGATRDEHRGRVDDVLARRPEVDVVGGLVADRLARSARTSGSAGFPTARPSPARRAVS